MARRRSSFNTYSLGIGKGTVLNTVSFYIVLFRLSRGKQPPSVRSALLPRSNCRAHVHNLPGDVVAFHAERQFFPFSGRSVPMRGQVPAFVGKDGDVIVVIRYGKNFFAIVSLR